MTMFTFLKIMLVWFVYFSWKLNMIWVLCIYAVSLKYERTFKSYCSQYILIVSPLKFVTNVCPRRKSHSYLGTFYNTFLFQLGRWLEFIMSSTLGWICFFYCRWQKLVTNLWKIFWPLPSGIGATASSALEIVWPARGPLLSSWQGKWRELGTPERQWLHS